MKSRAQGGASVATQRRRTRRITLGAVSIGDGAPISVQTMTTTDTRDARATAAQIREVVALGCDIVRLAVPDAEAAKALCAIRAETEGTPLVADIHFDYRLALDALDAGVDGLRLNPGNIGGDERVRAVADKAAPLRIPIRIGVNAGSLEKDILARHGGNATAEAMVESALRHVALLERCGHEAIKISVKASDVPRTLEAYRLLAERTDHPLHLGVTEAGTFLAGTVRSSVALGQLLAEGIGDTVRVSLADSPEREVRVGAEILRCLGLRAPGPNVTACPTCGRTQADVVSTAQRVEAQLESYYRECPEAARPHVAVMGCVVNGLGEARDADIAVVGGRDFFDLYIGGRKQVRLGVAETPAAVAEAVRQWAAKGETEPKPAAESELTAESAMADPAGADHTGRAC